jgi:hypothetical protein
MRTEHVYQALKSDTNRVFVSEEGMATLSCPHCAMTRQVPVTKYRGKQHMPKVRCTCGQTFTVNLEFRQQHRKNTQLKGTYHILNDLGDGQVVIRDLSRNGIGFTVAGVHNIHVGQKLMIDFVLDNQKQTALKKQAVVKAVNMNLIGCEFKQDHAFEKDLGFYLSS